MAMTPGKLHVVGTFPGNPVTGSLSKLLDILVPVGGFCFLFGLHARWVLTHFSTDGYLFDSGWLAYLFESKDALLHNPSSINTLSFYAHHLSPHIFLFGAPLASLGGFNGFEIFAYHQGLFFGLFFVSATLMASSAPLHPRGRTVLILSAVLIGGLSNALFQAAGYPHYEIAMIAISSLTLAAWVRGFRALFVILLLYLPMIREDGGLYAAFICLMCLTLEYTPGARPTRQVIRLAVTAVFEVLVAVCAFLVKARLFPGFDAFAGNFSGSGWDHVSGSFALDRIHAAAVNPNIGPVLIGSVLLSFRDVRYLIGLLVLSPLYLLHMLSVRAEHGYFTLYYALPWLIPPLTWLAVFVTRCRSLVASGTESMLILVVSLALAAPVHAALHFRGQFWYVAQWAFTRPVVDIASMKEFALWVPRAFPNDSTLNVVGTKNCASMGIAALIPNSLRSEGVVNSQSDLAACRSLLLLKAEVDYGVLRKHAETAGFSFVADRYNAELWLRRTK